MNRQHGFSAARSVVILGENIEEKVTQIFNQNPNPTTTNERDVDLKNHRLIA
jgi:hypothetical protein